MTWIMVPTSTKLPQGQRVLASSQTRTSSCSSDRTMLLDPPAITLFLPADAKSRAPVLCSFLPLFISRPQYSYHQMPEASNTHADIKPFIQVHSLAFHVAIILYRQLSITSSISVTPNLKAMFQSPALGPVLATCRILKRGGRK